MHPVLKRILLHGGLTAGVLALVGVMFAELAGIWLTGNATPTTSEQVGASLRYRVPLMMAFWGFVFVLVCELVVWKVRGSKPVKPAAPPPDDTEKLLNELLAQAEAKMALDAESQKAEDKAAEKPEGERGA